ncbi:MAG: hypothetical protein ACYDD4_02575 [Acidimicrobiales bacterium]
MDVELSARFDALVDAVQLLTPERICALATSFTGAESSGATRARRALARHFAMSPDTPGVIDILAGQLVLSAAMKAWEATYGLDDSTAYAARAAVLDMGLVVSVDHLDDDNAASLAAPWVLSAY